MKSIKILIGVLAIPLIVVALITIGSMQFSQQTKQEINRLLEGGAKSTLNPQITSNDIMELPYPVKMWLLNSGVVGKHRPHVVYLKQQGFMRTAKDNGWMKVNAEQYFNVDEPGFVWTVKADMNALFYFVGRDKFENGKGNMRIKLLSFIPIVNGKGKEIDQGTMLRYLGEICWFPAAAVCPYIRWEQIDSFNSRAVMNYKELTVSAVFKFDSEGTITGIYAKRYKGSGDKATLENWYIPFTSWKILNGIKIPVKGDAVWQLKDGPFNYYQWEITDISYK